MADDSDKLDQASTEPFAAVEGQDPADAVATKRLPVVDDDPPAYARDETDLFGLDIGLPDDDTGSLNPPRIGGATMDVPTEELPDEQTLIAASELSELSQVSETDETQIGAVSDDAILRTVVLPDIPPPSRPAPPQNYPPAAPPMRRAPPPPRDDATISADLPTKRRNPLPPEQRPPARGPAPLPAFQRNAPPTPDPGAAMRAMPVVSHTEYAHEAPDATRKRSLYAHLVAIGLSVVWLVVVVGLTLSRWLPPNELLIVSSGAFLPIALITAWVARPRGRRPQFSDLRVLSRPLTIAAALLILTPVPWQFGPIRGLVRPLADKSNETMLAVLRDRSDPVAAAECARVGRDYPRPEIAKALIETLRGRPAVVRSCLARQPELAQLISGMLIAAWYPELLSDKTPPRHACDVAKVIPALERPPGEVETRLLGCIMNAPPQVQRCCGAQLAAADSLDWVASVQSQPDYVPDQQTAAGLLALTFHGREVTAEQESFVEDASFTGEVPQRMAFVLGCAALRAGTELGDSFAESVPDDCPVDRDKLPRDVAAWVAVCDSAEDRLIRRRRDPRESLCVAAQGMATDHAAAAASEQIVRAAHIGRSRAR